MERAEADPQVVRMKGRPFNLGFMVMVSVMPALAEESTCTGAAVERALAGQGLSQTRDRDA